VKIVIIFLTGFCIFEPVCINLVNFPGKKKNYRMGNPVSWALTQIKRLNDAIWHTSLSDLSKRKTFLIKQMRIMVIAGRGFFNDKVQLRAASLTLYTLLSIIPIAAIAFAIAKGFGLDQNLESIVLDKFPNYKELLQPLLTRARQAIQATSTGYLAGIGVIILLWSVMSLLTQIESSFNHIWQIKSSRFWYRKFTDFLTIMFITPVFLILSSSITYYIGHQLPDYLTHARILDFLKPVVSLFVQLAPFLLTSLALTILFIVMPNAKVKFIPALIGGVITGSILQFMLWLYIDLQWGITKLSAIYGSFAVIPLFIIFIQMCWTCILLGAELSFANQNISRYEYEEEALTVSNYQKRALALMIMHIIVKNFSIGEKPIGAETISKKLKIPVRLSRDILSDLSGVKLVSEIHENDQKERLYQPSLDINKLSICFILSRLDKKGTEQRTVLKNREYEHVISTLDKFDRITAKSDSNILIKDI
jgi:membrane protein